MEDWYPGYNVQHALFHGQLAPFPVATGRPFDVTYENEESCPW